MTKRRRRLLAGLAALALVGVLALPSVHWRLIGWWRGEPFWRGRPASWYAGRIRNAYTILPNGETLPRLGTPPESWVRQHWSDAAADVVWGGPPPFPSDGDERPDIDALPVLIALMGDPDTRVR